MKTILPLLLVILLLSCKKDSVPYQPVRLSNELSNNVDTITKYLPGRWEWVEDRLKTSDGYQYYTPKTQGYKDYLILSNDTIAFRRNGEPDIIRTFKIVPEREVTNWHEDTDLVLVTYNLNNGSYASYYQVYICNNQLLLGMNYRAESPDKIYKRIQ